MEKWLCYHTSKKNSHLKIHLSVHLGCGASPLFLRTVSSPSTVTVESYFHPLGYCISIFRLHGILHQNGLIPLKNYLLAIVACVLLISSLITGCSKSGVGDPGASANLSKVSQAQNSEAPNQTALTKEMNSALAEIN